MRLPLIIAALLVLASAAHATEPAQVLAAPGKVLRLHVVVDEDTTRAWAKGRAILLHADCTIGLVWRHRGPRHRLTAQALDGMIQPVEPAAWRRRVSASQALVLASWLDHLCPALLQPISPITITNTRKD